MAVFDTEPPLIFYLNEEGAYVVEDLLKKNTQGKGFLNIVNLSEFYYILYRKMLESRRKKSRIW